MYGGSLAAELQWVKAGHSAAGEDAMGGVLVLALAASIAVRGAESGYDLFQKALVKERAQGDLNEAVRLYQRILENHSSDRELAAKALLRMGLCYEKQGKAEARRVYERLLADYRDQPQPVADAGARLAALTASLAPAASPKSSFIYVQSELAGREPAFLAYSQRPGPNLLLNPGFEDWESRTDTYLTHSGSVLPTGWSQQTDTVLMPRHWHAERVASCCIWPELANAVFQGEPHTGSHGLRLGGGIGLAVQTGINLAQDVPVVPGLPYLAGFWVNGLAGARRMHGIWLDAGAQPIGSAFFLPMASTSEYVLVQGATTFAPCSAARIRVQLDKSDWWSVQVDDAYLGQNLGVPPDPCAPSADIQPGASPNSIHTGDRGNIPVAILSTAAFDAPERVDRSSLTFGRTGDEASLAFCVAEAEDTNGDLLADLVCHFRAEAARFRMGDTRGILKGRTKAGALFILENSVSVVP